jgi:exopolysaccharide biosynthesis WecB/TagA/CpsF family protein
MPRTAFLGLDFDPLDAPAAARAITDRARRMSPFAYVATPNVDHMVRLDRAPHLRQLYTDAWLNLCDSRILEGLARMSKLDLPPAPGADIVDILFRQHINRHDPVTIIGGTPDLVNRLCELFGLTQVNWFDAPHGLRNDPAARAACVDFIREHPAPYVFLAVGSPQQEMIARQAMNAGCVGVGVCCGAALEFLTGQVQRAPHWMRANRLEWLHRLGAEPGRLWRRYLVDGPRILGVWRRWNASRTRPAPQVARLLPAPLRSDILMPSPPPVASAAREAQSARKH